MGDLIRLSIFLILETYGILIILWLYMLAVIYYLIYLIGIFRKMHVNIGPYPIEDTDDRKEDVTIDNFDLWDLDQTLAKIIHPALIKFREDITSYPTDLESSEEWEAILDKMILSFEAYKNGYEINTGGPTMEKWQSGIDLFAKYYSHLWN